MIRHIVLLQFKPDLQQSIIYSALDQLGLLKKCIPSIKSFSYGKNCSPENLNQGFSHVFVMEFEDESGRELYLNHPEHKRIARDSILPLLENGLDSALAIDYQLPLL